MSPGLSGPNQSNSTGAYPDISRYLRPVGCGWHAMNSVNRVAVQLIAAAHGIIRLGYELLAREVLAVPWVRARLVAADWLDYQAGYIDAWVHRRVQ